MEGPKLSVNFWLIFDRLLPRIQVFFAAFLCAKKDTHPFLFLRLRISTFASSTLWRESIQASFFERTMKKNPKNLVAHGTSFAAQNRTKENPPEAKPQKRLSSDGLRTQRDTIASRTNQKG